MASSSSISSESDENNAFKTAWKVMYDKCVSGAQDEKLGLLVRLWKSLEKEIGSVRGRKLYHKDYLRDLLKLTLSRSIESDWLLDSSESSMISSSLSALKSLSSGLSESNAIEHVRLSVKNPWNNEKLLPLLSKEKGELPVETLMNLLLTEGLDISRRRLEILQDTGYDQVVFNLAGFYVRTLSVQKFLNVLLDQHQQDIVTILFIWLTISFKLKDTSLLYSTLKSIPFSVVYDTLTRLSLQLKNARDPPDPHLKVYEEAYHDTLICAMDDLFTRKTRPQISGELTSDEMVVNLWVEHFCPDIIKIKDEVDIYLRDSSNSGLMQCLGYRLFEKMGEPILEISLSLIITGIIADLNQEAESFEDVQLKNQQLSQAFVLLSKLIPSNLTFRRECILTAFSVHPSLELMDQIVELAKESGFTTGCTEIKTENSESGSLSTPSVPELHKLLDKFEEISEDLIVSLEKGDYCKASGQAFKSIADKKERNMDGLLLIQGELLTHSANYDPIATPLKSLTPKALGLSSKLTADLVSVVNSPRWHFLSWVMEWPQLEKQCRRLLENPSMKEVIKDLKYLVIDYTQFDDWSSDEEISPMAGVEPGFEHWEGLETNDSEQIDEKGISDDNAEDTIQSSNNVGVITDSIDKDSVSDSKRPKLGPPSPEDIQTLINTVPGLLKPEPDLIAPTEPIEMDVRIVQLTRMGPVVDTSATSSSPSASDESSNGLASEFVRESGSSSISSVDSIANSLISQIQTPVISIPEKKQAGTLPFIPPPRANIIKIITPNSGSNASSSTSGEIVIKNVQESPENGQFDLIRQLNHARSQGLVVLQQWGDKQVLVHKATGRWIMRQGNRLVTVPPQALGIHTSAAASPSPSIASSSSSSHEAEEEEQQQQQQQQVEEKKKDEIKNNTMKQLAEFDSILESKFNGVSSSPCSLTTTSASPRSSVVSSPGMGKPQPTYVILRSSSQSLTTNTLSVGSLAKKTTTTTLISPLSNNNNNSNNSSLYSNASIHSGNSPKMVPSGSVILANKQPGQSSSKPQEDPVTLKRIQQILDDYNEQIRKSPDLQNRPAPRRRTLSTSTSSTVVGQANQQQQQPATSEASNNMLSSPPPTPPVLNSSISQESQPPSKQRKVSLEPGQVVVPSGSNAAILRQVVVPSSIAASLGSSKKQLVFLSGGGNKKILALKPLIIQQQQQHQQGGPTIKATPIGGTNTPALKTILLHQGGIIRSSSSSSAKITLEDVQSSSLLTEEDEFEEPEEDSSLRIGGGGSGIHEMLTPPPSSSLSPTMLSPPSSILLDRPSSPPGFGIPMEMTPGQIMEAEISANISDSPYSPLSQCSSSSNRSESF